MILTTAGSSMITWPLMEMTVMRILGLMYSGL